jgi:hypothetical protein
MIKPVELTILLFQALILFGIYLIGYDVQTIKTKVNEIRPISNITTEYVVIKTSEEDFDVRMK